MSLLDDALHHRVLYRLERVAWAAMLMIVVAALAGGFGHGPLSRAQAGNGSLTIHYERLQRALTPTSYRIDADPALAQQGTLALRFDQTLVDQMGTLEIVPQPSRVRSGPGYTEFDFDMVGTAGRATLAFDFHPAHPGRFAGRLLVPGQPAVQMDQFVYP